MGLDAVEMIMEIEDRFGITITDEEAQQIVTVGDMVSLIVKRLRAAATRRCFCLPAFFALRRVIRQVVGDDRFRLRPVDDVVARLSPAQRRELWKRLPDLLGTAASELVYPWPVQLIIVAIVALIIGGSVIIAAKLGGGIAFAFLVWTLVGFGWIAVTPNRLQTYPPKGWRTFADITRKIAGSIAATKQLELPDSEAVLVELRAIIVSWLGVDESKVVPEARFVEDLKLG